jgi:hypothetical protein
MLRRTIASTLAAASVLLTPALGLAAGAAPAHDHASRDCARCDCAHAAARAQAPQEPGTPTGTATTSPRDLERIWTGP